MAYYLLKLGVGRVDKMKRREETAELIVHQAFEESSGELSSKNPIVLSCGGIYIPYPRRKRLNHPLWKVLNLASEKNPTKVVSPDMPKSPLALIMEKESLN